MANRYEISDAGWDLVADLFTQTRRTGRPRIDDRLMLNGVLWVLCSGAAWRDLGTFDQMLKRLHVRLNERGLIDLHTWMIDSTAVRATRASSGAGKKGALTNPSTMRSVAAVAG